MKLRPYQLELVDKVRGHFAAGAASVLLQSGTGSGKTHTAAEILQRVIACGYRANFLAHLDTLIEDTHKRLVAAGVPAGFIQAGRPSDPAAPVQVCSLQTMHSRGERPPAQFLVLDECHRAQGATVRQILADYPNAALLGLTATPQRGDGKPLGDVFEQMVEGPSVRWLTAQGFLVPCDVLAPSTYQERGLAADPVDTYLDRTPGTRAIVFATNIPHARALTDRFIQMGVPAATVLGDTPRAERETVRARIEAGELLALVGVGVFIEGFDCPPVETIVLARAFGVTGPYLQSIGRGLRPSPATGKKRCTVVDLRGAVNLHGLPDEDRRWSLAGNAVVRTEPLKALQRCAECLAIFRPSSVCPRCGELAVSSAKVPRTLKRAEKLESLAHLTQAQRDARYMNQMIVVAARCRVPSWRAKDWAIAKFVKRFGRNPEAA